MKKETPQVTCTVNKNSKKKKKKDKLKKSDVDGEQKNSSFEISDSENNQKVLTEDVSTSILKQDETITSDDNKEINTESNNTDSIIKKKRKRNKGKKVKQDANLSSPVLRIMSK